MKRRFIKTQFIFTLLILISLTGFFIFKIIDNNFSLLSYINNSVDSNNANPNSKITPDSNKDVIQDSVVLGIVEAYNNAAFSKDWGNALKYLGGEAKKSFGTVISDSASNRFILLNQSNVLKTQGEELCVITSTLDIETIISNGKITLDRNLVQYYLRNFSEWRIIKTEALKPEYTKKLETDSTTEDVQEINKLLKDYISKCSTGNSEGLLDCFTGNYSKSQKNININPNVKQNIVFIDIETLGGNSKEKFVFFEYMNNNNRIQSTLYLVKIKEKWLISDQIS